MAIDLDASFEEELLAFGVGLDEVEIALLDVVETLWEDFDTHMDPLWDNDEERRLAHSTFDVPSLYEVAPAVSDGVVRIVLDLEADLAAEPLSQLVDAPVVAARCYGDEWCRLVLYRGGRARAWLFWARQGWADEFDGEVEPALAGAARANGGWVGDPGPFTDLLAEAHRPADLRRLLKSKPADAEDFVAEFYRLCGVPALS